MIDNCGDIRFRLLPLVRGELDPEEAQAVRRHLARCQDCAAEMRWEAHLNRRLKTELPTYTAPAELRARVEVLVRRDRVLWWSGWVGAFREWATRPLAAAALGAAAALLVAIPVWRITLREPVPNPLVAAVEEAAAAHQRAMLQPNALQGARVDVARASAELRDRYGLPAMSTFQGDAELPLLSVTATWALGRPGALFVFGDAAGRLVTLQIVRAPEVALPTSETTPVGAFRPLLTRREGTALAVWKQADVLYALAGAVDESELARLFLKVRQATRNPS